MITLGVIVVLAVVGCIAYILLSSKTYTVTFESANGTVNKTVEVKENETVNEITEPTKEGYTFEGWYIGEEKYDFSKPITNDITLTAKWKIIVLEDEFIVTFDTDGGNLIDEIVVKKDQTITKPADPTKEGYIFVEWQLEGKAFDFTTKIIENIELKAAWKEDETANVVRYTVTFDSVGGSTVSSKTVVEGSTVSKPTNPTKPNYNFVEWQLNGKSYNFSTKVTGNITLKAVWKEKDKVTVTFDSAGGSSVASRQVYQGNALGTLPENPTKEGFTFDGWYNGSTKYDASSIINNNITLTAKWLDNDEIALNNAKAAINNSYEITSGGQTIAPSYTGCTITHSNPEVIAKITRDTTDKNVTLNFNITCGDKTGTKSATGVIKASPYTYVATANANLPYYSVYIKNGGTTISGSGSLYNTSGNYLSAITSGLASVNNIDIVGNPNFLINLGDAKTLYIVKNQ